MHEEDFATITVWLKYNFYLSFRCSTPPPIDSQLISTWQNVKYFLWMKLYHLKVSCLCCMLHSFLKSGWIYRHVLCSDENFVSQKLWNLEIFTLSAFFDFNWIKQEIKFVSGAIETREVEVLLLQYNLSRRTPLWTDQSVRFREVSVW